MRSRRATAAGRRACRAVGSLACKRRSASTACPSAPRARAHERPCARARRPAAARRAAALRRRARAPRRCARWSAGGCADTGTRCCRSGGSTVQLLEHRRHALRRVARRRSDTFQPMRSASRSMSREKLSCPWIVAACPPMTTACAASALSARRRREQAHDHRRQADERLARRVRHAARDVALGDVRHLVRQHRGDLVARAGHGDQPEVHADIPARQRERVDGAVPHQERLPCEGGVDVRPMSPRRRAAATSGARATSRNRAAAGRRGRRRRAGLAHDLLAELALGADAESSDTDSPSAGRRTWARAASRAGPAGQRAGRHEAPRHGRRLASAVGARERKSWKGRRSSAPARCDRLSPRMMQRKHFPFVSMPLTIAADHFDAARPGAHGRRRGQGRDAPRRPRDRRHPDAAGDARAHRAGSAAKGDVLGIARIAAHPGGQAHRRARSRCATRCRSRAWRSSSRSTSAATLVRCTVQVETHRPHRRRDGSPHRRAGRPADDLRHVQGGRPRHGDRRRARCWRSAAGSRATGWRRSDRLPPRRLPQRGRQELREADVRCGGSALERHGRGRRRTQGAKNASAADCGTRAAAPRCSARCRRHRAPRGRAPRPS